jgi:DNA-3-methyladenine glycosylase II
MRDSSFELPLPHPFDFQKCLDYMARSPLECLYRIDTEGVTRLIQTGPSQRLIRVTCPASDTMLIQTFQGDKLGPDEKEYLTQYISDWFDLKRDLSPLLQISEGDPLLNQLTSRYSGLRIIGIPDLFEAVCWAIVGQQVNLAFAYKLKQRLTEQFGTQEAYEGVTYRMFPAPERFAEVSLESLLELQLTRNKAMAILEVASRIASGELSKYKLLALQTSDEVEQQLTNIRGIGPWTAQYVRMRCLGDTTACPVLDVGLQNALKQLLGLDRKPNPPELRAWFQQWPGWEAYIAFYLWRTIY